MTVQTGASGTTVAQRFRLWADRIGLSRYLAIALTVAAVASAVATTVAIPVATVVSSGACQCIATPAGRSGGAVFGPAFRAASDGQAAALCLTPFAGGRGRAGCGPGR